ncbi:MAG TPA: hypothetical protein VGA61_15110 [Anaerolineae bacterium]
MSERRLTTNPAGEAGAARRAGLPPGEIHLARAAERARARGDRAVFLLLRRALLLAQAARLIAERAV